MKAMEWFSEITRREHSRAWYSAETLVASMFFLLYVTLRKSSFTINGKVHRSHRHALIKAGWHVVHLSNCFKPMTEQEARGREDVRQMDPRQKPLGTLRQAGGVQIVATEWGISVRMHMSLALWGEVLQKACIVAGDKLKIEPGQLGSHNVCRDGTGLGRACCQSCLPLLHGLEGSHVQ